MKNLKKYDAQSGEKVIIGGGSPNDPDIKITIKGFLKQLL